MIFPLKNQPPGRPGFVLVLVLPFLLSAGGPGSLAPAVSPSPQTQDVRPEPELLSKAKAYCRRLQFASLYFVCREVITETIAVRPDWVESLDSFGNHPFQAKSPVLKHQLVYDYQFVRDESRAKETRTLVEEDGVRKNLRNADLLTWSFRYENVLFGPATLLDDRNSGRYDFAAEAETELDGQPAVVFSVWPKAEAEVKPLPFGRIWVSPEDGAVLKIEWDERSLRNYSAVEQRAKELGAEPRLTMTSEFGYTKNGIRFPGRHTIVEAYVKGKGTPFIRSKTVVEYVRYQFFTVETAVEIKKSP